MSLPRGAAPITQMPTPPPDGLLGSGSVKMRIGVWRWDVRDGAPSMTRCCWWAINWCRAAYFCLLAEHGVALFGDDDFADCFSDVADGVHGVGYEMNCGRRRIVDWVARLEHFILRWNVWVNGGAAFTDAPAAAGEERAPPSGRDVCSEDMATGGLSRSGVQRHRRGAGGPARHRATKAARTGSACHAMRRGAGARAPTRDDDDSATVGNRSARRAGRSTAGAHAAALDALHATSRAGWPPQPPAAAAKTPSGRGPALALPSCLGFVISPAPGQAHAAAALFSARCTERGSHDELITMM